MAENKSNSTKKSRTSRRKRVKSRSRRAGRSSQSDEKPSESMNQTSSSKKKSTRKAKSQPAAADADRTQDPLSAWIVVIVILGVLVGGGIFAWKFISPQGVDLNQEVLVTVNGEPIYADEFDQQFKALPEAYKSIITKEILLNQTVDKLLLVQEARKKRFKVDDSLVEERLDEIRQNFGITAEELNRRLERQNISLEDYKTIIREQLLVDVFLNETILNKIQINDKELKEFYDEHLGNYSAKEGQIRARHILVASEDEAWDIYEKAVGGDEFSDLAKEYSVGPSSVRGGDLGFFTKEQMVTNFSEAAFALASGDVSEPVRTEFGYHIIKRESDIVPLSGVKDEVERRIRQEQAQIQFQEKIDWLRSKATIVYVKRDITSDEPRALSPSEVVVTTPKGEVAPEE